MTHRIKIFCCNNIEERIEKLSQQDKLSKFCMDAGFLNVFSQFTDAVACREYTLPRDEETSEPKGWIRETPKLDPCWKLRPVAGTVNMELRSELCF